MNPINIDDIVSIELMIPSDTAGINLFVRNKRRQDLTSIPAERTLLFVSGSTYAASSTFDLRLDGFSWMDYLAAKGYDTYLVDVRGYGKSDKPAEMQVPAELNEPIVRTPVAVRDVASAAAFVRSTTGHSKIHHLGWSWGSAIMATYVIGHGNLVNKLVLVAPQWTRSGPSMADAGGKLGAYRQVARASAKERWLNGIPEERRPAVLPDEWFDAWADATFPGAGSGAESVLSAPNGTILDSREFWAKGIPLYDPSLIDTPVLIVNAEWDRDCPLEMSREVFARLTSAPYRRWLEIGEGTHMIPMEKNRWQLFDAVDAFLSERSPY